MNKFSSRSLERLNSCDGRLKEICFEAIKIYDFTVICGHRGEVDQNILFDEGKTKLKHPLSNHNKFPSQAVDIAPYPVDWSGASRFCILAGIMFGIACSKGIKIRWGGDWNMNWNLEDNNFKDLVHFELL